MTRLDPDKLEVLDAALAGRGFLRVADLGGVWGVDGGYAFHAVDRHGMSAVIADSDFNDRVRERCRTSNVTAVEGLLGDPGTVAAVGEVDAILLFDVLIHQVRPDWDALLELYAPRASCFVVFQPQWTGERTFRLLDLGRDGYFDAIPHDSSEPGYDTLFDRLDEPWPGHGPDRTVRDVHYIWQWAITDTDLCTTMKRLGFELRLARGFGAFGTCKGFERRGFVFDRE